MPRRTSPNPRPPRRGPEPSPTADPDFGTVAEEGLDAAEALRRAALGLTAALIVARAFWPGPGEMVLEEHSGTGSSWVAAVFVALAIALASMLIEGRARVRWSWADGAVYLLMLLVGLSSAFGAERRSAINLAWDWGGLGIAYFLARTLPRSRPESATLAGALMATAVAISAYGIYQATVELPADRSFYKAHKVQALKIAGVTPGTPEEARFEDRLLGSNEPTATFALANSLAGFLVGPGRPGGGDRPGGAPTKGSALDGPLAGCPALARDPRLPAADQEPEPRTSAWPSARPCSPGGSADGSPAARRPWRRGGRSRSSASWPDWASPPAGSIARCSPRRPSRSAIAWNTGKCHRAS